MKEQLSLTPEKVAECFIHGPRRVSLRNILEGKKPAVAAAEEVLDTRGTAEYRAAVAKMQALNQEAVSLGLHDVVMGEANAALAGIDINDQDNTGAVSSALLSHVKEAETAALKGMRDAGVPLDVRERMSGWASLEMTRLAVEAAAAGLPDEERAQILGSIPRLQEQPNVDDWNVERWSRQVDEAREEQRDFQEREKPAKSTGGSQDGSGKEKGKGFGEGWIPPAVLILLAEEAGETVKELGGAARAYFRARVDESIAHHQANGLNGNVPMENPNMRPTDVAQSSQRDAQQEAILAQLAAGQAKIVEAIEKLTEHATSERKGGNGEGDTKRLIDAFEKAIENGGEAERLKIQFEILEKMKKEKDRVVDEKGNCLGCSNARESSGSCPHCGRAGVDTKYMDGLNTMWNSVGKGSGDRPGARGATGENRTQPTPGRVEVPGQGPDVNLQEVMNQNPTATREGQGGYGADSPYMEGQRQYQAQQLGINFEEYLRIVRTDGNLTAQRELRDWLDREMSLMETATTDFDRSRAMNRIHFAINQISAMRNSELLDGQSGKKLTEEVVEKMTDRELFDQIFLVFDAAGKDEDKGFEGQSVKQLAGLAEKMFRGKEGEKRLTRMWRENLPTVIAMERNRERLKKWLDSKSAEEDNLMISEMAKEIATKEEGQSEESLKLVEGKVRRGIKWWRFIGRQALFDAYIYPQGTTNGIRRHDIEDKKLAQQFNGELYAKKKRTAGSPALQQVLDTEIRDLVSFMFTKEQLDALGLERDDHYRVINLAKGNLEAMARLDFENRLTEKGAIPGQELVKKWFENVGFAVDTYSSLGKWAKNPNAQTAKEAIGLFIHTFESGWATNKDEWYRVPLGTGMVPEWQREGFAVRRHVKAYQVIEMTYREMIASPTIRARLGSPEAIKRVAQDLTTMATADSDDKALNDLMYSHLMSDVYDPSGAIATGTAVSIIRGIGSMFGR